MVIMAEKGNPAGNDLVKEILAMGVSKYRMAKQMKVSETQIYNWVKGVCSPSQKNFNRLQDYRYWLDKHNRIGDFTG